MLDMNVIRKNPDIVKKSLKKRRFDFDLDGLLKLDIERREIIGEKESLQNRRKETSKQIGSLQKAGKDASEMIAATKQIGETIKNLEERLRAVEDDFRSRMLELPNIVHESLPEGDDESANRVERTWGEPPSLDFEPKDHVEIGEALGIIDLERATKVAGARFTFMTGPGARLERALINFMLQVHTTEHGYREILPPFIINAAALTGTGQLPKFEEDLFKLEDDRQFYLCPTAEVPVTNYFANEILDAGDLPAAFAAYTPCFRSEAGSYGKDTRGLIRQHQFNKVELVRFCRPEDSYEQLETLTGHAEKILQLLELPYRVVTLSTGDIGFGASKTYDLEVWIPSQQRYREISSCSNYEAFQARRAAIRYRPEPGARPEYLHTLNGSGLAIGRTVVALLENRQQADGSVTIPPALAPYFDQRKIIGATD
jgi:seryl-tRNA synthetase